MGQARDTHNIFIPCKLDINLEIELFHSRRVISLKLNNKIFFCLRHLLYFAKLLQGQTRTKVYCIYSTFIYESCSFIVLEYTSAILWHCLTASLMDSNVRLNLFKGLGLGKTVLYGCVKCSNVARWHLGFACVHYFWMGTCENPYSKYKRRGWSLKMTQPHSITLDTSVSCPKPWAHTFSPCGSLGYEPIGDRSPCLNTWKSEESSRPGHMDTVSFREERTQREDRIETQGRRRLGDIIRFRQHHQPEDLGFWGGEMTHLLIKQDCRHVSVTQHWKQTLNKQQSQSFQSEAESSSFLMQAK